MKTYDEILESMKNKYAELAGYKVPENSDISLRFKVLAGEIYKEQVNLQFIKNQMFVQTATGEYLDLHAADRGLTRKAAVKAKGKVKFILPNELETDLKIPKGTIVSTTGTNPRQYSTDFEGIITAGNKEVTLSCTAEEGGANSNVVIGAVNVLVTTVPGIEKVRNSEAFSGGTDVESDESLRQRIIDSYRTISNGTNKAYYKSLALSVPGVTDCKVCPKVSGTGTVDVYINSNKEKASDELVNQVQKIMLEAREVNVTVNVASAQPVQVQLGIIISVKEGYEFKSVKPYVELAVADYVNSLGIGDDIVENYFGKIVLEVEGVENYSFTPYYNSSYIINDDSFAVLESINIEEEI